MIVFVALSGEYDVSEPLGVFNSLEAAKICVEKSCPTYNTSVLEYDTLTGNLIADHTLDAGHYSDVPRRYRWYTRMSLTKETI